MSRRLLAALLSLGALSTTTAGAAAQACLGLPTRDGQLAVAGAYQIGDAYDMVGGEFNADTGPATIGFSFARDTGMDDLPGGVEQHTNTYQVRLAYELYLMEPSICPVVGAYFQDTSRDQLGIPVGIGLGKTLRGERVSTTLYALPQYVWVRQDGLTEGDDATTSNEFLGEAGITLGFAPFYVGGGVVFTTLEGDDTRFQIRAGVAF